MRKRLNDGPILVCLESLNSKAMWLSLLAT